MTAEAEEIPKSIYQQIKEQFDALNFTQTEGNAHYASRDADDLKVRNQSIDTFLSSQDIIEPFIAPTRHSETDIDKTIKKYEAMLNILVSQPNRTEQEDMLIDAIIDKSAELFRYEELSLAMGSTALREHALHRERASNLSMEMINGLDQPLFDTFFNELVELAKTTPSKYSDELLNMVGKRPSSELNTKNFELEDQTREIIIKDLFHMYPGLRALVESEYNGPISPAEAVPLFAEILKIADLDDEWSAVLRAQSRAAESNSVKKEVSIGGKRADFKNFREAVGVGVHEALVHAGRSEGIVMPGVLDFEEGFATRVQQIITGEKRTPGVQYYLSIGLQVGADQGGKPRSYRETFEIIWRREAMLLERAGKPVDEAEVRKKAQQQIHRTRRGGAVDTRDASYLIGAQKAAEWLNTIAQLPEGERRNELMLALTNKYDPTDPEQNAYVKRHHPHYRGKQDGTKH